MRVANIAKRKTHANRWTFLIPEMESHNDQLLAESLEKLFGTTGPVSDIHLANLPSDVKGSYVGPDGEWHDLRNLDVLPLVLSE